MSLWRRAPFPLAGILLITAALTQASCGARPPASPPASLAPRAAAPDWTLLVYMAADDDLESASIRAIEEMATVGSSDRVNVVVQIDRAAADRNGHGFKRAPLMNLPDFSSTKRILVKPGSLVELADSRAIADCLNAQDRLLGLLARCGGSQRSCVTSLPRRVVRGRALTACGR